MGKEVLKKGVDGDLDRFLSLYKKVQKRYGKDSKAFVDQLRDIHVPVSIFSPELSCLETLVRFLKENKDLSMNEIAELLGRSPKTIWQAYSFSKKKFSGKLDKDYTSICVPISVFKNRELSLLENLVVFLKEKPLKFSEIARLLHRDQRTVWTVHSRATKKRADR